MTRLVLIGIAAIVAFLNTTWLRDFAIFNLRPDLVLIILTFLGHRDGVQKGEISGFVIGLVEDALSISPLGFHAIARMVHTGVLGFSRGTVHSDSMVTSGLLVLIAAVIRFIVIAVIAIIFQFEHLFPVIFTIDTVIEIFLTAVLGVPVFYLLNVLVKTIQKGRG